MYNTHKELAASQFVTVMVSYIVRLSKRMFLRPNCAGRGSWLPVCRVTFRGGVGEASS